MSEVTIPRPSATEPSLGAVDDVLRALFREERSRWSAVDPALGTFVTELERFVCSGGKRLRPALVHWGFVASGGRSDDPAVAPVAAAIELLHAFALLHDDVMDGSETRRSHPSFHAAHRDAHDVA